MKPTDEQAIRERSYFIWQAEGCPEGRHLEHWFRAKAELEAEAAGGAMPARKRAAPRRTAKAPGKGARSKPTK